MYAKLCDLYMMLYLMYHCVYLLAIV